MSSGIFGPRAPSYPLPSYFNQPYRSPYGHSSHVPYTSPTYSRPVYPQQFTEVPQSYATFPYQSLPVRLVYPENPPYFSNSVYSPVSQYSKGISEQGLETILIAILVLVSLDLVFVRPLKKLSVSEP
ncbi:hypothetical protein [Desulfitobacterium metallireducens]|uniref:Uncharacterized protein n=1 Tax=Desulfitobacterium metallireducens DSM 15288 TaxID=871968 RepID=W0EDP7_9FIRM|nr:hypothetical protein [Desulfitobacterium metallireducens]AHF07319.1 hypothetical protein DESME_09980 [Desulfitobacterium metallireducens DSM 15288]